MISDLQPRSIDPNDVGVKKFAYPYFLAWSQTNNDEILRKYSFNYQQNINFTQNNT